MDEVTLSFVRRSWMISLRRTHRANSISADVLHAVVRPGGSVLWGCAAGRVAHSFRMTPGSKLHPDTATHVDPVVKRSE